MMDNGHRKRFAGLADLGEARLISLVRIAHNLDAGADEQLDHSHRPGHHDGGTVIWFVHQASDTDMIPVGFRYFYIRSAF